MHVPVRFFAHRDKNLPSPHLMNDLIHLRIHLQRLITHLMALGSPLRTMSVRPHTLAHLLLVHSAPPVATTTPSSDIDEGLWLLLPHL